MAEVDMLLEALRKNPQTPTAALPQGPSQNAPMQDIYAQLGAMPTATQMAATAGNLQRAQDRSHQAMPEARNYGRIVQAPHWGSFLGKTLSNLGNQKKARTLEKTLGEQSQRKQEAEAGLARYNEAKDNYRWAMEYGQESEKIAADRALKEATLAYQHSVDQRDYNNRLENRLNDDTRRLSEDLQPIIGTIQSARVLDEAIAPYMEGGEKQGRNVPGIGLLVGDPGWMGSATRLLKDMANPGSPNADMYSKVRVLVNAFIKADAGLTQTISEMRNTLEGMGLTGLSDEEVFLASYPDIRRKIQDKAQSAISGYKPEVFNEYKNRNQGVGQVLQPFESFEAINARRQAERLAQQQQGGGGMPQPGQPRQATSEDIQQAATGRMQNPDTGEWWVVNPSTGDWVPESQTGMIQRGPQ